MFFCLKRAAELLGNIWKYCAFFFKGSMWSLGVLWLLLGKTPDVCSLYSKTRKPWRQILKNCIQRFEVLCESILRFPKLELLLGLNMLNEPFSYSFLMNSSDFRVKIQDFPLVSCFCS